MNTLPDDALASSPDSEEIEPAAMSPARLLLWSLRRELWENRSIYLAPLAAAALILVAFPINAIHLPDKMRTALALDPAQQHHMVEQPYMYAALLIMFTTFAVALVYSMDALYGERRDRSILFWKSLPVSDRMTVLSKATIPIVILPLLTFAITMVTQCLMLLFSMAILAGNGQSVTPLLTQLSFPRMSVMLLYHLLGVHGLCYAPIYGWLLLVSAWARRTPYLWAAIPPFALAIGERIAFNTFTFVNLLGFLVSGGEGGAATAGAMHSDALTPLTFPQFVTSPELWIGLAVTAAFLAVAVRLRRDRGPT